MHSTIAFVRRSVLVLAAFVLVACDDAAPTSGMTEVQSGPAFIVSPGFPQDVIFGCSVNWPVVGGACETELGVSATVSPGIYLDSVLISAGFSRELSSVPVRRIQYYTQNSIPIPPSPPLTIALSAPVRGMIVQIIPYVSNRTAYATVRLTEADGSTSTYELSRACTFVNSCRIRPSYTSDVGFTRVEISVPEGVHFGASLTLGGVVSQSNGVTLSLSAPTNPTRPSELAGSSGACRIEPVIHERTYGVLARRTSGEPAANVPLTLSLGAIDGSGGHLQHFGPRPAGSFSAVAQSATAEVVTDADGRAQFTYYAPEFAGRAFVRVNAAGATEQADTFTVGVPLARMTPGRWQYDDAPRELHADAWYAAPQMIAAAGTLADSVHARWGQALSFGDMSLPMGGRFDAAGDWTDSDHCSHRWGNALDLPDAELSEAQRNFIALRWRHLTGRAPVKHSGRLHLQTWREL